MSKFNNQRVVLKSLITYPFTLMNIIQKTTRRTQNNNNNNDNRTKTSKPICETKWDEDEKPKKKHL